MCFTECGTNHTVAHSQANFTERTQFHYGTVVPIYCDKGYEIVGNNFAVCQEDGTWSKTRCRKKGNVKHILAHRIGTSENLPWIRKSYLTHAILSRMSREG